MDSTGSLFEQRRNRILRAITLQKPDRIPVVLEYAGFAARITLTPLSQYSKTISKSVEVMIRAFHMIGDADAINYGLYSPYGLSYLWMSKVKVPGVDLPEDAACQVVESKLLLAEDYDQILSEGWPPFFQDFMKTRVLGGVSTGLLPFGQPWMDIKAAWAAHGIPVLSGGAVSLPFELLCGARSLTEFFTDLLDLPDKVQRVMDVIMPHVVDPACKQARASGLPAVWIGGWRGASNMISPALWERFVWPYLERAVHEVIASGLIPILHLDSDWTRDLPYFRSLPAGKCVLATDGQTDLFKAKKILGDRMCLMGDVPAAMLAFGKPDEIREYCRKLIRSLGPEGYILHSGCDIPMDAQLANVQTMVSAVKVT